MKWLVRFVGECDVVPIGWGVVRPLGFGWVMAPIPLCLLLNWLYRLWAWSLSQGAMPTWIEAQCQKAAKAGEERGRLRGRSEYRREYAAAQTMLCGEAEADWLRYQDRVLGAAEQQRAVDARREKGAP